MQVSSTTSTKTGASKARKYELTGIFLFPVGLVLGGVGNSVQGALPVIPFADTMTALGFVLALLGAVVAGSTLRQVLIIAIIFGIGTFYVGEPHSTHIGSGWGLGLEHMTHIFAGLALIGTATAISAVLAFYHTRSALVKR